MAHPELDALLGALMPQAQRALEKQGRLAPLAMALRHGGEVERVGEAPGVFAPPPQATDFLVEELRERAWRGGIRAAAVCCEERATPPGSTKKIDTIRAHLEHDTGEAVTVFLPFSRGNEITFGDVWARSASPIVFIPARRERDILLVIGAALSTGGFVLVVAGLFVRAPLPVLLAALSILPLAIGTILSSSATIRALLQKRPWGVGAASVCMGSLGLATYFFGFVPWFLRELASGF